MSYKFDSLIIILNKLDRGEAVTVQSLINDLEISERTVHRYIRTLLVAGFPISYHRAREIYSFDEGFSLRKPNLTLEETLSFALAKSMLGSFGSGMSKGLDGIEEKLSKKANKLPSHIILSTEATSQGQEYLGIIHQAISNFQRIEIDYKTLYSDEQTLRKVDSYYLFLQDGFWHLRGYCNLREDFRTFALDRILNLKVLDSHFLPRKVVSADELSGSFGSVVDGEPVDVILRFEPEIKPYILRKKWHQSQQEKELKGGRLEIRFKVNGIEGIKRWIYRWVPFVEVLEPKELRAEVLSELKAAARKNQVI